MKSTTTRRGNQTRFFRSYPMTRRRTFLRAIACASPLVLGQLLFASDFQPCHLQKLYPTQVESHDQAGRAVAIDDERLVLGTFGNIYQKAIHHANKVFVFRQSDDTPPTWFQEAVLIASEDTPNETFGASVLIQGSTLVVGAPSAHGAFENPTLPGSAYLFERINSEWTESFHFQPDEPQVGDSFGAAVDLYGDTLVVGAPGRDETLTNAGAVYIFVRENEVWQQQAKLTASIFFEVRNGQFGKSVALHGNKLIVGAPGGEQAGSALIFERIGDLWQPVKRLVSPRGNPGDAFGISVDMIEGRCVVGSYSSPGIGHIFEATANDWIPVDQLVPVDNVPPSARSISFAIQGEMIVVGSNESALLFRKFSDGWQQHAKIVAPDWYRNPYTGFGFAVAANQDQLVIGSPGDDYNSQSAPGSAYVFDLDCGEPGVLFTEPPDRSIDPRQPREFWTPAPGGFQYVLVHFDDEINSVLPSDFLIEQFGADGDAPYVVEATFKYGHTWHLALSGPISTGAWTKITHLPTGQISRLGYLPCDVNGDGVSTPHDILTLIDSHLGTVTRPDFSADINRDGYWYAPADILRLIDMLNGVDVREPYFYKSLPPLP